jgi:hypothetical protein
MAGFIPTRKEDSMRSLAGSLILLTLLTLPVHRTALAETTYTCPSTFSTRDESLDTIINTNLSARNIVISMDIFTEGPGEWASTAGASTIYDCEVAGIVTDQGSRVLLSCNCIAPRDKNGISPIHTSITLIVPAGSQCSYGGNLQFSCE